MRLTLLLLIIAASIFYSPVSGGTLSANTQYSDTYFINLRGLSVEDPLELLCVLDSLEAAGQGPSYKIKLLRARAYSHLSMNYMALRSVEKGMEDSAIQQDTVWLKYAYRMLAEWSVLFNQLEKGLNYIIKGERLAQQWKDTAFEASMMLAHSDMYRRMRAVSMGYEYAQKAAELLEGKKDASSLFQLSHIYGYTMAYRIEDKHYEEAWRLGQLREQVIEDMHRVGAEAFALDDQQGYCFSKMAYLAQLMGNTEMAASYYHRFMNTDISKTIQGRPLINDYLLAIGKNEEVLENNRKQRDNYTQADTLNLEYIRLLHQDSKALSALGRYQDAYREVNQILNISNTMRTSRDHNYMMELADLKNSIQREADLHEASYKLEMNNKLMTLLFCIVLISLTLCIYVIRKYREIRRKNRKMVRLAGEVVDYKKRMTFNNKEPRPEQREENSALFGQVMDNEDAAWQKDRENSDLSIFMLFEQEVREQHLFLDYQLGREYYTKLMGVDKNRFAYILKKYGQGNLSSFLNNMRLEYAVGLLKDEPELSINDVASKSALPSSSTFFRLFKEKYGVSPKKFREILGE